MKIWQRFRKQKNEDTLPAIVLTAQDGTQIISFPIEAIAPFRRMVAHAARNKPFPARLSMVASLEQEGVSYLTQALAATMAHDMEVTVCIVELNWQRPSEIFASLSEKGGAAAVLIDDTPLEDALVQTEFPNLALLPAGDMDIEKRSILSRSSRLKEMINQLEQKFDHILLDIPAISTCSDVIPLASLSDDACLIIHQGATQLGDAQTSLDSIDHLSIIGVIMNQVHLHTPSALLQLIPQH